MKLAVKYGFLNKIALVSGENQQIGSEDVIPFFEGDDKKISGSVRDLKFIDILRVYHERLLRGGKNPFENTLNQIKAEEGSVGFDATSFPEYYKELNARELSRDPRIILNAFTLSIYLQKTFKLPYYIGVNDLSNR